jgi:hypothetical protein
MALAKGEALRMSHQAFSIRETNLYITAFFTFFYTLQHSVASQ